jgi:hypothetical protein
MDILDNIMFAKIFRGLSGQGGAITSDYLTDILVNTPAVPVTPIPGLTVFNYDRDPKFLFCTYDDPAVIEQSIIRHWYDIARVPQSPAVLYQQGSDTYSDFTDSTTYHLIYAYLIENTRIVQIFEKLIEKYYQDEELGIAENGLVFRWIQNTERLFFKNDSPRVENIRSLIRPSYDASRRNAYFRMFGMDLAFGDLSPQSGAAYHKAKAANQQFVPLFERYLSEIWQGYLNARNTSGPNTTDINNITLMATQLQEMLLARRGGSGNFAERNLSREEFSAVLLASWFTFAISYNSPLVDFLSCESSTIGERLMKIGDKVGVPSHRKAEALFEMAAPAATILTAIEVGGILDQTDWVNDMLSTADPSASPTPPQRSFMTDFLSVINNWEKATGHRIKNPEATISGTVKVQQSGNGVRPSTVLN